MGPSSQCPWWCAITTPHESTHEALRGADDGIEVWLQSLDGVNTLVAIRDTDTGHTFWPPLPEVPSIAGMAETLGHRRLADLLRDAARVAEADNAVLPGGGAR